MVTNRCRQRLGAGVCYYSIGITGLTPEISMRFSRRGNPPLNIYHNVNHSRPQCHEPYPQIVSTYWELWIATNNASSLVRRQLPCIRRATDLDNIAQRAGDGE
jgi:hypothetical protein